ncbi:MAG: ABC transporter substrate-binding protein [Deltaproteobacteria bacterium]|nr:ABC transporter substrate-binding protein [Deltaproteobacteria bacterium]
MKRFRSQSLSENPKNPKSAIQNPKWLGLSLIAFVLVMVAAVAWAQQPKVYRVGFLRGAPPVESHIQLFRHSLKDLGYIEGKNTIVEYRWARGKVDQLPRLAAELVGLKLDVIVADGSRSTQALKTASSTIAIVMQSGNPIELGFVSSLARPGGNVTGLTSISGELGGKLLELLKEILPRLTRVTVILPDSRASTAFLKETATPAQALRVQLIPLKFRAIDELERTFQSAIEGRAEAIIERLGPATPFPQRKRMAQLATKNRLPAIGQSETWADDGGLVSYGPDRADMYRQFAMYVDKILKGAKPADLPIEQPTKFELVINLNTAKQIGLTIPPNVLARADKVIR